MAETSHGGLVGCKSYWACIPQEEMTFLWGTPGRQGSTVDLQYNTEGCHPPRMNTLGRFPDASPVLD